MQEQLVAFQLADEIYGLNIGSVREIIRLQPITHVPEAPAFIDGIISLRNKIIPVIDLRHRLGLPANEDNASSRIMVLDISGVIAGIKVDAVLEVLRLEEQDIEPVPVLAGGIDREYLLGVARWKGRLIILLDGAKVLNQSEQEKLSQVPLVS